MRPSSASRRSEALCLDLVWLVSQTDERVCHGLDERRRSTDVDVRPVLCGRTHLRQHLGVDAARVPAPAVGLRTRECVHDAEAVAREVLELVAVDDLLPTA